MTELEHAIKHIKTRADAWAVEEVTEALQSISVRLDKALSQEPCDDAISRDAVIGKVKELFSMGECYCDEHSIIGMINELPPVTQKSAKDYLDMADRKAKKIKDTLTDNPQKSGKWHRKYDRIVNDLFWECDKCGCGYQHEYNYCPNCGAKMESESDA